MTPLYLQHIAIRDFRTFGQFEIDLPPRPGLTLLTGTNGLGKSSFFDAIEWGLTGQIRRIDSHLTGRKAIPEGKYLNRRGAEPDAYRVMLGFSEGESLVRAATAAPLAAEVTSLLARGDWGPIRDVGTYLAFTHFLGQAAQQRFTNRKGDEQWDALKGPSGLERLERIRRGLRGRPTLLAFTKRIDGEKDEIKTLELQLAQWQDWRERAARLEHTLQSTDALDPEAFASELSSVASGIASAAGQTAPDPALPQGQVIEALRAMIAKQQDAFTSRLATLDALTPLPEEWAVLTAQADEQNPAIESATVLLAVARGVANEADTSAGTARVTLQDHVGNIAVAEARLTALEALRRDKIRLTELETDRQALASSLTELAQQIATADLAVTTADRRIAERKAAEQVSAQARQRASALRETLELAQSIDETEAARSRAAREHKAAADIAAAADERRNALLADQAELAIREAELEARLEALRTEADAIAVSVAAIAGHLHEDDTDCPICHSQFAPGELQRLAAVASAGSALRLVEAELAAKDLREQFETLAFEIATLDAVLAQEAQARAELEQRRLAVRDLREQIATSLGVTPDADLTALTQARDAEAYTAQWQAEAALEQASTAAGTESARAALVSDLQALRERHDGERDRLSRIDAEWMTCSERLAANSTPAQLVNVEGELALLRADLGKLLEARPDRERVAQEAATSLDQARAQLREAELELVQAEQSRQAAERSRIALEARWRLAGLQANPDRPYLEVARSAVADRRSELAQLERRLELLRQSGAAALLREELARIEAAMLAASDADALFDQQGHADGIAQKIKTARAKLRLSTSTRSALNKYTKQLQGEAERFSDSVLAPLNEVIDAFNEAMLSTPGETINLTAGHRVDAATRFDMTLRYKDKIDEATLNNGLPPHIMLSEGQLAANGFSILCAASTAYPWSRWRALLLDDPLQHNDIIHTAAFVDVMRNLVEYEGYQLIMSSHDRAESEFIARKFDAAGLPCTTVTLTAPAVEGVQYEGPVFNSAARGAFDLAQQAS
jgi:DNA repair exonuclease SbcCD ATPase subunit